MLRTTVRTLITPKGRNYTFIKRGDNKGRLSIEAVAGELGRHEEYTRALLMPYSLSTSTQAAKRMIYPSMLGRSSRPGDDNSGFVKAFPLFGPKPAFTAPGKVRFNNYSE